MSSRGKAIRVLLALPTPSSYASTAWLRFGAPLAKQAVLAFSHDVNMVSATRWPVLFAAGYFTTVGPPVDWFAGRHGR